MAAATQVETVNITINDVEIAVPKGELIVESVKRLGLEIPIFCYHARMKPVGMCRMCLVEVGFKQPDGSVRKMPKPQAACTLPASDGMAVFTDTELVHRDRKGVLEFLLINHPLDCPICDRGGECPLQNNTLFYGPSTSRFVELKRHLPKAFPLSEYVTLDLERCIQCGRCVRFTEEISGDSQLAFRFRGASMQPSTFELTNFESKFSGNVIEICPVGALTSAKYRFRARPWDLETRPAICTVCSNGCNVWFDYRVNRLVRINGRTNEAVNEEWTCDRGKFGHGFYNAANRLSRPLARQGDALVETDWADAYSQVIRAFSAGGTSVAAIGGATCSNEDLYMLQRLFRGQFGSNNLDHRFQKFLPRAGDRLETKLGLPQVRTSIASLEDRAGIFVFGTSLADELPIVFLRVRKAWFNNGAKIVVAHHAPTDVDSFADVILRYREGTELVVAAGLMNAAIAAGKVKDTSGRYDQFTPDYVETNTGVPAADLRAAAGFLAESAAPIITTRNLMEREHGMGVAETLGAFAKATGGEFNFYGLLANDEGADRLGILPDMAPGGVSVSSDPGLNTHEILEACADGRIRALWIVNNDPLALHHDRDLVVRALENVEFLVFQGVAECEAMHYASIVLPQTAAAECDGTFTNVEGRVQRFGRILAPIGEAKPAWRIFSEILLRLRPATPMFNPGEVMDEIAAALPGFAGARYDVIPQEGYLIGSPVQEKLVDLDHNPPPQVNG
jgi:NADH-quinone oxidoreductase subunit G